MMGSEKKPHHFSGKEKETMKRNLVRGQFPSSVNWSGGEENLQSEDELLIKGS